MKKRVFQLIAMVLVAVLLAGLAACGGNNPSGSSETAAGDTGSTTSAAAAENTPAPKYKIKFASSETGAEISQNSPIEQMMEERYGAEFDFVYLTNQPLQQLNLLLAGNDLPDWFAVPSSAQGAQEFMKTGMAEINPEEVKEYMPKYWEYMEKATGNFAKYLGEACAVNGKIRFLPSAAEWAAVPLATWIRKDRLDDLGVGVPTTIAEYENVLKLWKEKYKTYPLNYRGDSVWQCFMELFNAYGVALDWWTVENGKIVYNNVRDITKTALAKAVEWYKAGYVNPEYVTYKDNSIIDPQFEKGEILIRSWQDFWKIDPENTDPQANLELKLRESVDPKADIELLPLLKSELYPNVQPTWPIWDPVGNGGSIAFGVHLEQDRDKLHRIMEIVDDMTFNKDAITLYAFGVKDEDWVFTADGAYKYVDKYIDNTEAKHARGIEAQAWNPLYELTGYRDWFNSPKKATKMEDYKAFMGYDAGTYRKKFAINAVAGPLTDASGNILSFPQQANTNEYFQKIITGAESIDYFDQFVKDWYGSGGEQMTEAANRLYLSRWID